VFGEGGKPRHNSVVSTFCDALARAEAPKVIQDGPLELLHAQSAGEAILRAIAAEDRSVGEVRVPGRPMRVSELLERLSSIAVDYRGLLVPDLSDPLHRDLFNTYRSYLYPSFYPAALERREDARGSLFEAVKTRHGGQAFFSTTRPGITRGNHFHLRKLERFCVVRGDASIRIRRLFSSEVMDFRVSGEEPRVIDIPTLHTHSLTNTGDGDLMTLFWANEIFDPEAPDTFAEAVERGQ
jgi:UDP-2-acetamido-2,6-beta-L-arabino-hexul-4-ose reductase